VTEPPPGATPAESTYVSLPTGVEVGLRSFLPAGAVGRYDFWDRTFEWRRLAAEFVGTFFLVLVAVGAGMVNARFGGHAVPQSAQVVVPGLMVAAAILFMGAVSGAHLNPAVSIAFAVRGNFPWRRVPGYLVAQFLGGVAATLLLVGMLGSQGTAGLTVPGHGVSATTALLFEAVLTVGLVSTILGTASGAQQLGSLAAIGVGSYIALAGLWGAPVSGASMNTTRTLAPDLVTGHWTAWWAYVVGPMLGALVAVVIAFVLRGRGGGSLGSTAAQGTLGITWRPGPIGPRVDAPGVGAPPPEGPPPPPAGEPPPPR